MCAGCSGESRQLTVAQHTFDDILHGFLICVIQQIIHFIDDYGTDGLTVDFFLFNQIQYTPRGPYNELWFFFQLCNLVVDVCLADDAHASDIQLGIFTQLYCQTINLHYQLMGWCQNQSLYLFGGWVDLHQNRTQVSQRFTASGMCLPNNIASFQHVRNYLRLNIGRLGNIHFSQCLCQSLMV